MKNCVIGNAKIAKVRLTQSKMMKAHADILQKNYKSSYKIHIKIQKQVTKPKIRYHQHRLGIQSS